MGSRRKLLSGLSLAGLLLMGWAAIQFMDLSGMNVWAGSRPSNQSANAQGDPERGRAVFNGKGVCSYCHGVDGYRDRIPQLEADTAALIAQLNPPPPDLRNRKTLRLTSDKARFNAIREGHPGTGMFPDTTMTAQELTDTLAYLAVLRKAGAAYVGGGLAQAKDGDPQGVAKHSSSGKISTHPAGDGARGEKLYNASCVVCHGPQATGGIGPRLTGNPVLSNEQAFWKVVYEGRHVMPPLKGTVTEQQLADIQAWLKTLR